MFAFQPGYLGLVTIQWAPCATIFTFVTESCPPGLSWCSLKINSSGWHTTLAQMHTHTHNALLHSAGLQMSSEILKLVRRASVAFWSCCGVAATIETALTFRLSWRHKPSCNTNWLSHKFANNMEFLLFSKANYHEWSMVAGIGFCGRNVGLTLLRPVICSLTKIRRAPLHSATNPLPMTTLVNVPNSSHLESSKPILLASAQFGIKNCTVSWDR